MSDSHQIGPVGFDREILDRIAKSPGLDVNVINDFAIDDE